MPLVGGLVCLLLAGACTPVEHKSGEAAPAGTPAATSAAPTPAPTTETTPPPVTPSTPPSTEAADAPLVLGPDGYGALKIGMTEQQAEATGLVTDFRQDGCVYAFLRNAPKGQGRVYLSKTYGPSPSSAGVA
ncbi:hypothetical protein AB0J74_15655 [Asanoa sp. NPDC049573]|uniref:hypothetical protein n=1 Tax=Asanoa sp. NPDC049573 TaxID=3155396 RepID=UPI003431D761